VLIKICFPRQHVKFAEGVSPPPSGDEDVNDVTNAKTPLLLENVNTNNNARKHRSSTHLSWLANKLKKRRLFVAGSSDCSDDSE
jgi:hypothetical protein